MTNLGTLGGTYIHVSGINAAGQVAASANTAASYNIHAYISGLNGVGMTDPGYLGGYCSAASGINDAGQVIGESYPATGAPHAFITSPNGIGMADLNSLVSLPAGIYLAEANGINNHGHVVAIGYSNVVPEPETYALLLAGLGLIGVMARRRKAA